MRLIEKDAVTVLAYGDAAVFDLTSRRAILHNLDREDPYFRSSEVGITAIGGLAGEDLASDFASLLQNPPQQSHRLLTVLEALTVGRPVNALLPLLQEIAMEPQRPEWQRWRAADAFLNGADDVALARRALLDAVASEPPSPGREALRLHLASALPSNALSVTDIKSLISDGERCREQNTVRSLYTLTHRLEAEPRPELFEEPTTTWLPRQESGPSVEVKSFLDHALAAAIRADRSLPARQLWTWICNVRDHEWSRLAAETTKAVDEWLDAEPGRDVALFNVIMADEDPDAGPWMTESTYAHTIGRLASGAIIRDMLDRFAGSSDAAHAKKFLERAVHVARRGSDAEAYWEVYAYIAAQPCSPEFLEAFTVCPIEPWRQSALRSGTGGAPRRRAAQPVAENIEKLDRFSISSGSAITPAIWTGPLKSSIFGAKTEQER